MGAFIFLYSDYFTLTHITIYMSFVSFWLFYSSCFWDRVSFHSQVGLEILVILLPQPSKYWGYRHELPYQTATYISKPLEIKLDGQGGRKHNFDIFHLFPVCSGNGQMVTPTKDKKEKNSSMWIDDYDAFPERLGMRRNPANTFPNKPQSQGILRTVHNITEKKIPQNGRNYSKKCTEKRGMIKFLFLKFQEYIKK